MRRRPSALFAPLLLLAVLLTSFAVSGAAQAAAPSGTADLASQRAILGRVLNAPDPSAVADSLNASDRALLTLALSHQEATTVVDRSGQRNPTDAEKAAAAAIGGPVTATACWWRYWYTNWSDLGYDEGSTWMQLNWCGNAGRVTSYNYSNAGGVGRGGFSYKGIGGHGALNVGWEVRQYVMFQFSIAWDNPQACMQIRGGATGAYSLRKSCNLA
jgi:hypothetical protein